MRKLIYLFIGALLYPMLRYWPVISNLWIFGAQNGQDYVDNSKYLFEYLHHHHPQYKAVWVTRSKLVLESLRKKGLPVVYNLSLRGLWFSATAAVVAFSTSRGDVLFVHKKKSRKIVNLWHGMPIKKIAYDYEPHSNERRNWRGKMWGTLVAPFDHKEVSLIASTSEFFSIILKSAFRNNRVFVTGQPRTDAFERWDKNVIKARMGFSADDKIISYMPTHRAYGKGEMNPRIFETNERAINFFQDNGYKVVWKFHKNMVNNYDLNDEKIAACFVDLSMALVDPQELLFVSDILITDHSSCFVDFLLLNRPVIFYFYDNYVQEDNELYFEPESLNVGAICHNEKEVLESIKSPTAPNDSVCHQYKDDNSSQRVLELIESHD